MQLNKQIETIESISFEISSYFSNTYKVFANKNIIQFSSGMLYHCDPPFTKEYNQDELQQLINSLNKINVLNWKSKYETIALDGTQWELELKYNNSKTKKIYGSNAYPLNDGQSFEPTELFNDLLNAFCSFIQIPEFFTEDDEKYSDLKNKTVFDLTKNKKILSKIVDLKEKDTLKDTISEYFRVMSFLKLAELTNDYKLKNAVNKQFYDIIRTFE